MLCNLLGCVILSKGDMMKKKYILYSYLTIHMMLYLLIYVMHAFSYRIEIAIDYGIILSCVLIVLFFLGKKKDISSLILSIAFFFTLLSDTLLLWLDDYYEWALFFFILVQLSYFAYILYTLYDKKCWKKQICFRFLPLILLFILYFILGHPNRLLICLSIFYIILLLWNVVLSLKVKNKNRFLSIGLILFLLCDICVGCMNIIDIVSISSNGFFDYIAHSNINFSWLFYHPSQVLLSLCDYYFPKKK